MSDVVDLPSPTGNRRLGLLLSLGVAVLLGALILVLATSEGERGLGPSPLIGQAAPSIDGPTTTGETFTLDDHRGRWVVVNFFATTCIPCIVEHPELVSFDEAHQPVGDAAVVSIAFSDTAANVEAFFDENGGDWDVLAADTGRHAVSYGVAAVPETYLVAPSGIVTSKFIGGITEAQLDAEIVRLSGSPGTGS